MRTIFAHLTILTVNMNVTRLRDSENNADSEIRVRERRGVRVRSKDYALDTGVLVQILSH